MSTPILPTRAVFADSAIQQAIDSATAKIPAGQTTAVVAHADLNGASLTVVRKFDEHWSIEAACIKPWDGPLSAGAEVIASW